MASNIPFLLCSRAVYAEEPVQSTCGGDIPSDVKENSPPKNGRDPQAAAGLRFSFTAGMMGQAPDGLQSWEELGTMGPPTLATRRPRRSNPQSKLIVLDFQGPAGSSQRQRRPGPVGVEPLHNYVTGAFHHGGPTRGPAQAKGSIPCELNRASSEQRL